MEAARRFAEVGRAQRYLVSTSQAVDVMGGGVKGVSASGVPPAEEKADRSCSQCAAGDYIRRRQPSDRCGLVSERASLRLFPASNTC